MWFKPQAIFMVVRKPALYSMIEKKLRWEHKLPLPKKIITVKTWIVVKESMQCPLKELTHVCLMYAWEDEYIYVNLLCKMFAFE